MKWARWEKFKDHRGGVKRPNLRGCEVEHVWTLGPIKTAIFNITRATSGQMNINIPVETKKKCAVFSSTSPSADREYEKTPSLVTGLAFFENRNSGFSVAELVKSFGNSFGNNGASRKS